jgi:hypothetical protein
MTINPTSLGIDTNAQKSQLPVQEQAPVQPPPGALETFNSFLQRYVESNPALGLSNFQITPEALAVLGSKPENKLLAGIGSAAKGFSEGWGKVRAEQNANVQAQQKEQVAEQERTNKVLGDITAGIKADTNFQDEVTRADAISQAKDLIKNGEAYGDKFQNAFNPIFMQIVRPEFKRITGSEPEGAGSIGEVVRILTSNGILKSADIKSEGWQKFLKGGILVPEAVPEFNALIKDFENRNKVNYARYAQTHVNKFKDMGAEKYTKNYIPVPKGYSLDIAEAEADTAPDGSIAKDENGNDIIKRGDKWEILNQSPAQ